VLEETKAASEEQIARAYNREQQMILENEDIQAKEQRLYRKQERCERTNDQLREELRWKQTELAQMNDETEDLLRKQKRTDSRLTVDRDWKPKHSGKKEDAKKRPQPVSSKKKLSDKNRPLSASDRFRNTLLGVIERKESLTNMQLAKLADVMKVYVPKRSRKEDYIAALKKVKTEARAYLIKHPGFLD
jgi:hypothetical protein